MTFKPPTPRATLAGCSWLPRLLYKAAAVEAGNLPESYRRSFGNPEAMDGRFVGHFGLALDEATQAAKLPEAEAAAWFLGRTTPERIAEWNALAPDLGRAGHPMHERFTERRPTIYPDVDPAIETIFGAIEADEA